MFFYVANHLIHLFICAKDSIAEANTVASALALMTQSRPKNWCIQQLLLLDTPIWPPMKRATCALISLQLSDVIRRLRLGLAVIKPHSRKHSQFFQDVWSSAAASRTSREGCEVVDLVLGAGQEVFCVLIFFLREKFIPVAFQVKHHCTFWHHNGLWPHPSQHSGLRHRFWDTDCC